MMLLSSIAELGTDAILMERVDDAFRNGSASSATIVDVVPVRAVVVSCTPSAFRLDALHLVRTTAVIAIQTPRAAVRSRLSILTFPVAAVDRFALRLVHACLGVPLFAIIEATPTFACVDLAPLLRLLVVRPIGVRNHLRVGCCARVVVTELPRAMAIR